MTRDDIIRMARECGLMMRDEPMLGVERFAALAYDAGVAAEREACAQLAETAEPYQCADLIRARGR
jgi:hypothetical protein